MDVEVAAPARALQVDLRVDEVDAILHKVPFDLGLCGQLLACVTRGIESLSLPSGQLATGSTA
jgi:hypothetical protein